MSRYTGPTNKLFRNKKVKDLSNRKLTTSMRQTASGQHGAVRKKLSEYALHLAEKQKIRGLLVAPSINDDAQELLNQEGIEFVSVEPPKELKTDKKVTLDIFQ